jgi:uncharacterized protein YxjI
MTMELLERDLVVVKQKAKLVEVTNQYFLQDADGNEIGWITEENQSTGRKVLRALTKFDQFLSHQLGVADANGQRVLTIKKNASFMKATVDVFDVGGQLVGSIRQENVIGKIRFALVGAAGEPLGALRAENWRAWDFHITDVNETEVARITKKWAGILREGFTTADNYVFTVSPSAQGPLRLLSFAAAAAIDTALKQNDR